MASGIFSITENDHIPKWIFRTARIFGYWPFNIDTSSELQSKGIRSNIRNFMWPLIAILIYASCIYVQVTSTALYHLYTFSTLEIILDSLTNVGYALTSILTASMGIWNRNAFAEITQIIRNADREVRISESSNDWNRYFERFKFF